MVALKYENEFYISTVKFKSVAMVCRSIKLKKNIHYF